MYDKSPSGDDASVTATYRCVCGASLSPEPGVALTCETCGRRYSDEVATGGGMETLRVTRAPDTDPATDLAKTLTAPDADTDPLLGSTLGHFKIIDRLGSGGMGAVYRALDESLQRYVALKVIFAPRGASAGEDTGTRTQDRHIGALLREARAQARVRHPNVVHIYYVSREADASEMPFLAMELVDGGTLATRLTEGPTPFGETIEIALQATEALRQSAKYDIVHGDVKPSNLLLDSDGTVRLSDFGISRRLTADEPSEATGTPNYMSPEICDGTPPDCRSDQYSLGVMLFEMTFGRLPYSFPGNTLEARKEAHRTYVPEFPDPWPATLPEGWRGLLYKLLAKNPDDRFPDYDHLISALRTLRPISLPPAGRLVRLMAWATDVFLALAVAGLFANIPAILRIGTTPEFLFPVITGAVLVAFAYLQTRWGVSLGKKVFQINTVDLHGLPLGNAPRLYRTVFQYLPVWILVVSQTVGALGFQRFAGLVGILGLVFLAADVGTAFFRRDRRSLHDLMFGTKVALSAHRQD